jgi:phage terminase small subunit
MALNAKQAQFVAEYLIDGNATQAAMRSGYSRETAYSQGHRLLKKAEIRQAIDDGRQAALQAAGAEAIAVVRELVRIANADIAGAFNADGSLKPVAELPEDLRRAVSGVDVDELWEGRGEEREQVGVTKKLRLWDKTKALELLGRHLKMFSDKLALTDPDGAPLSVTITRVVKP